MAYDFSKQKVSVKEISDKKKAAVAATKSSNKQSSNITPVAATPSATKSDTWNKDKVALAEAKQQTEDVLRGVIDLDTGSTSLELSEPKETISLEQARQQTTTVVRPATNTSQTKTTDYVSDTGEVVAKKVESTAYVPVKVGSGVRQSAETVTTVKKSGDVAVIEAVDNPQRKYELSVPVATVPDIAPLYSQKVQDAAKNLNASIDKDKVFQEMGGSTTMNYTPEQRASVMQEKMEIDLNGYITEKAFNTSQSYAAKVVTKGDSLVEKLVDTDVKIAKTLHVDGVIAKTGVTSGGVKDFLGGAVVDNVAGIVVGLGAVPVAIEATVKDTDKVLPAVTTGAAVMAKDIVTNLANPETRARTSGQLVGAIVGEKVIGKGATLVGDEIRTFGKVKIPIENLTTPEVVSGKASFPMAKKGTSIESIINDFRETKNKYPKPDELPKHADSINIDATTSTVIKSMERDGTKLTDVQKAEVMGGVEKYNEAALASENEYGIHVNQKKLADVDHVMSNAEKVEKGLPTSEADGLYVAPDASLHFAKVSGETKYKLFGKSDPTPDPTINFMQMRAVERLPEAVRADNSAANRFLANDANKGTGYTTVKMEQGLKVKSMEKELTITPGTEFMKDKTTSRYYTRYGGRKIPVNVYRTFIQGVDDVDNLSVKAKKSRGIVDDYDSYGRPIEKALIDVDSLALMASSSRAPKVSTISPRSEIVVPRVSQYGPKTAGYIPKGSGYTPRTRSYIPKTSRYLPKSSGYTPKPDKYTPKPENYLPKTDSYVPKPKTDNNYPLSGIELPNNKRRSRRGKENRFRSQYDRLYNQYGDISKWKGF